MFSSGWKSSSRSRSLEIKSSNINIQQFSQSIRVRLRPGSRSDDRKVTLEQLCCWWQIDSCTLNTALHDAGRAWMIRRKTDLPTSSKFTPRHINKHVRQPTSFSIISLLPDQTLSNHSIRRQYIVCTKVQMSRGDYRCLSRLSANSANKLKSPWVVVQLRNTLHNLRSTRVI